MASRIKRKPEELRDQLGQAFTAINALGAGWPSSAPTKTHVQTAETALALEGSVG